MMAKGLLFGFDVGNVVIICSDAKITEKKY
jgi:hypothetical protein